MGLCAAHSTLKIGEKMWVERGLKEQFIPKLKVTHYVLNFLSVKPSLKFVGNMQTRFHHWILKSVRNSKPHQKKKFFKLDFFTDILDKVQALQLSGRRLCLLLWASRWLVGDQSFIREKDRENNEVNIGLSKPQCNCLATKHIKWGAWGLWRS